MPNINVFCENYGWLFEDLKAHFSKINLPNISIICTNKPIAKANAWIAIRTEECKLSPNPSKTAVCIHDLKQQAGLYSKDGLRVAIHQMKGLVMCHPEQRSILSKSDYSFEEHTILERPLGALKIFSPANRKKDQFTIGWVGKDHPRKRLDWLLDAIRCMDTPKNKLKIILVGMDLGRAQNELQELGIACSWYDSNYTKIEAYPDLYRQMDCLMISGRTEAGPLPLFEALASGIPVISTPVGWAPWFANQNPKYVRIATKPKQFTKELELFYQQKEELNEARNLIAELGSKWRLEEWCKEVLELAASLITDTVSPNQDLTFVD